MINQAERDRFQKTFNVSRETLARLDAYAALVVTASETQNLVSRSSIPHLWERHILDSAQLLRHIGSTNGSWLDVGSGAGFPALVIACMHEVSYVLVEPRRLRAEFLNTAVRELGLETRVAVAQKRVEAVEAVEEAAPTVITGRAFASLTQTLQATVHLGSERTTWLLHKGRHAASEVADAQAVVSAEYELLPSITDLNASLVRVRNIRGFPQ